ncbi:alkaline phosphatase family protein [Zobellia amurskyensis]|uniref:Alkaline phosphatase family protein n=1 Tax=Zobellia amurskyensis TaxID=248905 RepID=A0A7X2ZT29_9FLAO|nr:alkaline phosphatase D family protein [Zobellia amurskyensis]MUH35844.1 alkaline phosphatase family protein [Zobellia amurskyensis]
MLNKSILICFICLITNCKTVKPSEQTPNKEMTIAASKADFTLAFGSCNKQNETNLLWDDILKTQPDLWVWGGDNIYADTDNMKRLRSMYTQQNAVTGYQNLKKEVPIIGTWDDHDYGLNDGGVEFDKKEESQQEFLDFMGVDPNDPRRTQEGVYSSHTYNTPNGSIKVIVLDTRYFRTALTPDTATKKRTKPNTYGQGTVLGETQWSWLAKELNNSEADFNLLVSSIQILSNEHGFETWGNFPHEVDKLEKTIVDSKAKGVMILSGDRHISEFSKTEIPGLQYPLVDFTSSGLTHSYTAYKGETNPFRVGDVVSIKSFGLIKFNFKTKEAWMQMLGDDLKLLGELHQTY